MKRPALALAALLAAPPALRPDTGDRIESSQKDLKKIREELSQKERERRGALRKARELEQEVGRMSRELRSARRSLKEVESRLGEAEARRTSAEERLWASRLGVGQWNDLLRAEMRRYYERAVAAEAGRFAEMGYRRSLLKDKARGLGQALERHNEIEGAHQELLRLESELGGLRSRREREERRVSEAQKDMRSLYDTVQGRRAVLEEEIVELNASAARFEEMIKRLIEEQRRAEAEARAREAAEAGKAAREKAAVVSPSRKKGRLPWPVEGTVTERFGKSKHPELDTYVFSNGVRLRPAKTAPVRAVGQGEVLFAGEFMGYGLMALISHPEGMHSIYAHMGELKVVRGRKVSVGEAIGVSGQDAEGRPQVYFELRVQGVAVDPLLWLR